MNPDPTYGEWLVKEFAKILPPAVADGNELWDGDVSKAPDDRRTYGNRHR